MAIKHDTTSITAVNHGTTSLTAVNHGDTPVFPDTWTLTIIKADYMATVSYIINSGSAVAVDSSVTLTLTVDDSVYVTGTTQSEAPYNYGTPTGTGTFAYTGVSSKSTTVACTRTVKSYTFTLTKNSNVSSISISRTSSPYQGASTGTLRTTTGRATIYYGDVLSGSATAATGYHFGSSNANTTTSYSNSGVTADVSWSPTVSINTATVYIEQPVVGGTIKLPTRFTNCNVWISTSSSSTSGSTTSGTYNYNTTVYGYVKVNSFHNAVPSGWTRITGTQYLPGVVYRTGSCTVTTADSYNLTSGRGGINVVLIVILKKIGFYHMNDGIYRPSGVAYGSWQHEGLSYGSFSSSNTLTISAEAHTPGDDYDYYKNVTWTGGSNMYLYNYVNGYGNEISESYFTIYRVSLAGTQTAVQSGIYSGSASLSTSYAYFLIGNQDEVSTS